MPNQIKSSLKVIKRIELILGKAQIDYVNYYLAKQYNEPLQNAKWMTTLEACQKGIGKIIHFNYIYCNTVKHSPYFIDDKALEDAIPNHQIGSISESQLNKNETGIKKETTFSDSQEISESVIRLQALKKHFSEQLITKANIWNQSQYAPLMFLKLGPLLLLTLKQSQSINQHSYLKQEHQTLSSSIQNIEERQIRLSFRSSSIGSNKIVKFQQNHEKVQKDQRIVILGKAIVKSNHIFLVKTENDRLIDAKWTYFGGPHKYLKEKYIIQKFNLTIPSDNTLIFDKQYVAEQIKQTSCSLSMTSNMKYEHQLMISYDLELGLKSQYCQDQDKVAQFIAKKINQLDQLKQSQPIRLSILQIIGKAKVKNLTLYLVKGRSKQDKIHYTWRPIISDSSRPLQKKLLMDFNKISDCKPLPFIIDQYSDSKMEFIDLLSNNMHQKIEKVIAKKVCPQGVFYLANFKDSPIEQSQWFTKHSIKPSQYSFKQKTKHFNRVFAAQTVEIYLNKETILIELYKEIRKSLPKQLINSNFQVNQKLLYQEAEKAYKMFMSEAEKLEQIFPDAQSMASFITKNQAAKKEQVKIEFRQGQNSQSDKGGISSSQYKREAKASIKQEQIQRKKSKKVLKKLKTKKKQNISSSETFKKTRQSKKTKKQKSQVKVNKEENTKWFLDHECEQTEYEYWFEDGEKIC